METPTLEAGSICCALFSSGTGDFHWAIVIPVNGELAHKMHATNVQGGWVYERKDNNIANSKTVCVVVKIGTSSWGHRSYYLNLNPC